MHVVLLTHEYPPFIFGGIGTFTKNLAYGLSKMGVNVSVICGYPVLKNIITNNCTIEQDNGITIIRYPYPNIQPRHTMFQIANLRNLTKTIKKLDVDIIHGQSGSTFPSLLSLKNIAPFIVTFHSSPKAEKSISCQALNNGASFGDFWTYILGYPIWSYTYREELRYSNLAVAVSKNLMSELIEEMGENYRQKFQEIHNGIDLETLDREYDSGEKIVESDKTIFYAGRMFWRKGALNLVALAYWLKKRSPDFKIIAHGEGPLLSEVKSRIHSLGLTNIELKGFTSKPGLIRTIKRSKFVLVPSYYEACPMTLLESMCLGKIPIMMNMPFAKEFTDSGKYGLLAKDMETLAYKLKTASTESDIHSFSKKIRLFAREKYDIRNVSLRYIAAYSRALSHAD